MSKMVQASANNKQFESHDRLFFSNNLLQKAQGSLFLPPTFFLNMFSHPNTTEDIGTFLTHIIKPDEITPDQVSLLSFSPYSLFPLFFQHLIFSPLANQNHKISADF